MLKCCINKCKTEPVIKIKHDKYQAFLCKDHELFFNDIHQSKIHDYKCPKCLLENYCKFKINGKRKQYWSEHEHNNQDFDGLGTTSQQMMLDTFYFGNIKSNWCKKHRNGY